ncbi:ABC transporter substrate-binding protein [Methylocapsa acidiphila]|uniref:ABC transporter substrate-binding protein n=1 Tax=Methylocapsa acidiphila TaxID=133552 RepID=UPI000564071E|nr:ABC transporter substrate-binding protein [Methylocapsa acidiphila]
MIAVGAQSFASEAQSREIIDMVGRHVVLPNKIGRIFSAAPPTTLVVYAMKPDTLIGWNFAPEPPKEDLAKFLDQRTIGLPVLGNMMGHGQQANLEEVLAASPDLVVAWANSFLDTAPIAQRFEKAGVPVIFLKLEELPDYVAAFALMGEVLDLAPRGRELGAYVASALARVEAALAQVPSDQRVRVYYAETPDGLATDCDRSIHAEAIRRAGGINVYQCAQGELVGMERISLEQVVRFAPDMIVAQDRSFARMVSEDARWRNVKAVASGQVRVVPRIPFNWIDRPPGYMEALGVQWLANWFYPNAYPLDLQAEVKKFYNLFFNVDLGDGDVVRLLH